ncbi:unnamed protein product [Gongylonema pulchrum]|uniref:Transcriptional regulator n=1 Tax=Gongylonema pulchrum TaxID=637853 RepID=A0A183D0K7_9BILA|nr:unnamed protein product [Gongylonema pulchrum]
MQTWTLAQLHGVQSMLLEIRDLLAKDGSVDSLGYFLVSGLRSDFMVDALATLRLEIAKVLCFIRLV